MWLTVAACADGFILSEIHDHWSLCKIHRAQRGFELKTNYEFLFTNSLSHFECYDDTLYR